jgi:Tfp pilus assembly protein PilO
MQIDRPIAIAIMLFIILLLVFFLVLPEYNTFGALRTQLGEKKAEFNAEFDYYSAITKTYYDLQSRKDDIKKIDDALPSPLSDPIFGKLIYFIQETAKETGLMIKDISFSKSSSSAAETGSSIVKDIVITTNLLGDYQPLGNFITSLEKSSRVFEVMNISFGSSAGPPYSFSLQIKTHSY